MKKANGPKKKKNKLITHLLTMPQAAGKKYYYALLKVANYAHTLSRGTDRSVYVHALSSKVNVLRKSKNKNCRGISFPKISSARARLTTLKWLQ